ncbi:MCP four helix bundle domain-containing protein [Cupriavidus sp. IDO]|uniref:MCP four helix bundle domain-containing protein n=1 Tax=Cupriavidus sp. IDO TaxID=1539142 RepID=UPI000A67832B|nr:MCP four helix bundle domain-containing protein [Cupriavidus sp. IDO]
MTQFVHTIKFRIILAFGICIVLMLGIGLFALEAIFNLNQNMHNAYVQNTVAIGELMEVRASQLHVRRLLWKIRATSEGPESADVAEIAAHQRTLQKAWSAYYPARVISDGERVVADALDGELKTFLSLVDQELQLINTGAVAEAAKLQDTRLIPVGDKLGDSITRDVELNVK